MTTVTLELRFKPDEVAAGRELMGRVLRGHSGLRWQSANRRALRRGRRSALAHLRTLGDGRGRRRGLPRLPRRRRQDHPASAAVGGSPGQDPPATTTSRRLAQGWDHFSLKEFHPRTGRTRLRGNSRSRIRSRGRATLAVAARPPARGVPTAESGPLVPASIASAADSGT